MSLVTPHQTDLTTFCKFKREHMLRRALHLLLNQKTLVSSMQRLHEYQPRNSGRKRPVPVIGSGRPSGSGKVLCGSMPNR